MKDKIVKTILE